MKIFQKLPPLFVTLKKTPFWTRNFDQDEIAGFERQIRIVIMKKILQPMADPKILILLPPEISTQNGAFLHFFAFKETNMTHFCHRNFCRQQKYFFEKFETGSCVSHFHLDHLTCLSLLWNILKNVNSERHIFTRKMLRY